MFFQNIIILIFILAILYTGWETYQEHGGGFAVIKIVGGFTLLYSAIAILGGLTPEARIFGFVTLIPGLWLFLFT